MIYSVLNVVLPTNHQMIFVAVQSDKLLVLVYIFIFFPPIAHKFQKGAQNWCDCCGIRYDNVTLR